MSKHLSWLVCHLPCSLGNLAPLIQFRPALTPRSNNMRFTLALLALSVLSTASLTAVNNENSLKQTNMSIFDTTCLYKRRGGGGGGGGHGGADHGGGGRGSHGGSGGKGGGKTSANSNAGGISHKGSGTQPAYGSGRNGDPRIYGGGVIVPYPAGGHSPTANLDGKPFPADKVAKIWPGYWGLFSVYFYPYHQSYSFRNESTKMAKTETLPVICLCAQYVVCGCDETGSKANLQELVGKGDYKNLNRSLVLVTSYDRRKTIFLNGTLANGTTTSDAPRGLGYSSSFALGFWLVVVSTLAAVFVS